MEDMRVQEEFEDHLSGYYDFEKMLGKGAYGIVWKARSRRSGRIVAVKKIFDAFKNQTDAQRTFREIVFLKEFRDHPNIIRLLNVHRAANDNDLYLVFEHMDSDLQKAIHKYNPARIRFQCNVGFFTDKRPGLLKDVHKRFIMYQLLSATRYIHSGNVIHRDQKPSNILLDTGCNCKIADFGLARSLTSLHSSEGSFLNGCLTDYVATRWYRAPEILLGSTKYTKGIDLWSLGCILGEMLSGKPLFPGSSSLDQVEKIFSRSSDFQLGNFKPDCSDYAFEIVEKVRASKRKPTIFEDVLENCCQDGKDLVQNLLKIAPEERLSADEALKHPYVSKFQNGSPRMTMKVGVIPPLNDDVQLSVSQYKDKLYEIIRADRNKLHL